MNRLGKDNSLCSQHRAGKPGLPVNGGVAFVNMTRQSFRKAGLDAVLSEEYILFLDDVNQHSPYCADPSGKNLREFLREAFPPLFPFQLGPQQMNRLRALLFPVVRIEVPRRGLTKVGTLVREGCPMAEIAVIYASRRLGNCTNAPQKLRDALEKYGLMVTWVAEDARAKRRYDVTTDSIPLSTVHSVKGMDYAHVFLVGLVKLPLLVQS